jgi:hypothetical protein
MKTAPQSLHFLYRHLRAAPPSAARHVFEYSFVFVTCRQFSTVRIHGRGGKNSFHPSGDQSCATIDSKSGRRLMGRPASECASEIAWLARADDALSPRLMIRNSLWRLRAVYCSI